MQAYTSPMRVLIAPDSFGDTLTAVEAVEAIAAGWSAARPADELVHAPQSDGGPGFVDVLATAGGEVQLTVAEGPLGGAVTARWLLDGDTAYLESAQACGLGLLGGLPTPESAVRAQSRGVGQLLVAAIDSGASQIVVGLGGSSCTDGGRGLVAVLGGLSAARVRLQRIDLVAATDVENPMLGTEGAAHVFGPQKGADAAAIALLESRNTEWADQLRAATGRDVAESVGAGAAGGIGGALLALGARRISGARVVADRTKQDEQLASADLVITGEGRFDEQSLRGKLVIALAESARAHSVRTLVLAGQVDVERPRMQSAGIDRVLSMADAAGSVEAAISDASSQLRRLAEYAARTCEHPHAR